MWIERYGVYSRPLHFIFVDFIVRLFWFTLAALIILSSIPCRPLFSAKIKPTVCHLDHRILHLTTNYVVCGKSERMNLSLK